MIKIFKKAKILEKSQIRKLIDFVNRYKGSTFFQTYSSNMAQMKYIFQLLIQHFSIHIIIHLIIKVKTINIAIVAL
jgi:hypothetical protein